MSKNRGSFTKTTSGLSGSPNTTSIHESTSAGSHSPFFWFFQPLATLATFVIEPYGKLVKLTLTQEGFAEGGKFLDGMALEDLPRPVEVVPADGASLRQALAPVAPMALTR